MSNPGEADVTPIVSRAQLAEYMAAGAKPRAQFRIGAEHEKFGFSRADLKAPPYEPGGIRAVLDGLAMLPANAAGETWQPIEDHGHVIGLKRGGASVSLEPAGQLELSGAPLETLHEVGAEQDSHFAEVRQVAEPLGLGFSPLGFHPLAKRADMPWMPKSRYAIMRRYMPLKGRFGLDMMTRTCTVQVNLDFESEADMVRKLHVGLALQPLATALFANSPFTEGRPNGLLSARAEVWTDTDNERSGIPPVMFQPGFGFERYVDWLLDVPMYFVARNGEYIDLAGSSFHDFMAGRLPALPGERPTVGDFADHMTTVFTDVRLKRFLEMRGADAGTPAMMLAQSALWVGLLYDPAALEAAHALVRRHPWTEFAALRPLVPHTAMATPWQGGTLRDLAAEVVAIATGGLRARRRLDAAGRDEAVYLEPLHAIAEGAPNQAEAWLNHYDARWHGKVDPILGESAV